MRIVAMVIVAVSLVVAIIGALTAYVPRLDEQAVAGLHLNAAAGSRPSAEDGEEPIAEARTELTPEVIAELREADVQRVRVREFSPRRWTGWWLFAVGCAGLLGAGIYLRQSGKTSTAATAFGATTTGPDPAAILASIRQDVAGLLERVSAEPPAQTGVLAYDRPGINAMIIDRVGELQRTHLPAFIAARPAIVAAGGMAGYANLMDAYAAGERALNRAWSAAADNDEGEALTSLERAAALLEESANRLPQHTRA
jgi:hypothetical protein